MLPKYPAKCITIILLRGRSRLLPVFVISALTFKGILSKSKIPPFNLK